MNETKSIDLYVLQTSCILIRTIEYNYVIANNEI